jgi:hypothetical protein
LAGLVLFVGGVGTGCLTGAAGFVVETGSGYVDDTQYILFLDLWAFELWCRVNNLLEKGIG